MDTNLWWEKVRRIAHTGSVLFVEPDCGCVQSYAGPLQRPAIARGPARTDWIQRAFPPESVFK